MNFFYFESKLKNNLEANIEGREYKKGINIKDIDWINFISRWFVFIEINLIFFMKKFLLNIF